MIEAVELEAETSRAVEKFSDVVRSTGLSDMVQQRRFRARASTITKDQVDRQESSTV